ncbi:MAG: LysR family transcriptional regulator [Brachybacterium faecium]|nr:MAG: LysR family transcriptional regulator [Brachybacterium faecium]
MLDVRRLKVLRSVIASGSVAGAAQALGYTPSSISQQIAALQRETGLKLLEHVGRGVRPTAAAELLNRYSQAVFEQLDRTEQAISDYREGHQSRLRMEYFATAGRSLVAPAVAALAFRDPGTHVELRLQPEGDPLERIWQGETDLAIVVAESPPSTDGLTWTHLADDPFMAVLPSGHRLCAYPRVHLEQLADIPWVTNEWPLGTCSEHVIQACVTLGFEPRYSVECNDIDTAHGLIAAGTGIGVMPSLGLGHLHPDVVVRPLEDPSPIRRIYAVHGPSQRAPEIVRLLSSVRGTA